MYHPTTRALAVLALLQRNGRMTGAELARRLEVNQRTVRTYITMLQDLGAPIVAERGRDGAYEIDSGFRLPPMMFTNDEAIALEVGLLAARHLGIASTVAAIESAREKLEAAMPDDLRDRSRTLTGTITLGLAESPATLPADVMLALSAAAHNRQRTHIHYRSRQSELTERDFDPYGLAYHGESWYAVGFCGLRHDLRSFRLDRIEQIAILAEHFERPKSFDALAYIVQSFAVMEREHTFRVLLHTDLESARVESFEMFGTLEPADGGVLLTGTAGDLDWVARQLSRFSFPFAILEPDTLRESLHHHATHLINLVQDQ